MLATSVDLEVRSLAQLYRDRADAENGSDELKIQWGWGGFTTRDLTHCRHMARPIAPIYRYHEHGGIESSLASRKTRREGQHLLSERNRQQRSRWMPDGPNTTALTGASHSTIYVGVEISLKSWIVGVHCPDASAGSVSIHTLAAADTPGTHRVGAGAGGQGARRLSAGDADVRGGVRGVLAGPRYRAP